MNLVKNSIIRRFCRLFFFVCLIAGVNIYNAVANETLQSKKVFSGLGIPWGMDFLSNQQILVTEKRGVLSIIDLSQSPAKKTTIQGLPDIMQVGQGGLLDINVEPTSLESLNMPTVYFTYVGQSTESRKKNLPTLKLAKAQLKGTELVNLHVLFEANKPQNGGRHFGSRITFDQQGHVFFSMGDRGQRENSQDLSKHSGSIFRLNLDGSIPDDNPFVGQKDVLPEIWSFGHRNPQGLMFDYASQQLWSIEHGPRGGDEINLIEKGKNYGWPIVSYGREYISNRKVSKIAIKDGLEKPVHQFTPSIAPSSLLVYSGKKFPKLRGSLFSGALKLRHLNSVTINKDNQFVAENRFFEKQSKRIRNIVESPDGELYFSTDSGDIFKIDVF